MNDFVKRLPKAFKTEMAEEIFHTFCTVALELGLIKSIIYVLVDYTHEWFYGLVCPQNEGDLTGSNKGPGTKWGRKYGALMLCSGTTRLFCGLFLSKKGHSKVPDILHAIDLLRAWGFTVEHVTGDREISCYDVMSSLLAQGTLYLGSIKRLPKVVKDAIKAYLAGTGKAVTVITLLPTPACQYNSGPLQCHLILKARPGQAGPGPPERNRGRDIDRTGCHGARARVRHNHARPAQSPPARPLGTRTSPEVCEAVEN